MRFAGFFSTLALLPTIISASPVAISRRDNSTSVDSLAQDAINLMGIAIDISNKFVTVASGRANSSDSFLADFLTLLQTVQDTLGQRPAFQAFNQTINDINCTYTFDVLVTNDDPGFVDLDLELSEAWTTTLISLTATSLVANATALGLNSTDVQMIQNAGELAFVLSDMLLQFSDEPVDVTVATTPFILGNWEIVNLISLFQPQCTRDPGINNLGIPTIPNTASILPPLFVVFNETDDFSSNCPNGQNDTNCFCQVISSTSSEPLITPAQQCNTGVDPGLNFLYFADSTPLSIDPVNRTEQALSGHIFNAPGLFLFGPASDSD